MLSSIRMLPAGFLLVTLGASLHAQALSATVNPNPALPGQTVVLTVTAAQPGGVGFPTPCLFESVHLGAPDGPVVDSTYCLMVPTPLPWSQSLSQPWQPPWNASGLFYFRISYMAAGQSLSTTSWVPFSFQIPSAPALVAQATPQVGQPLPLLLNSPDHPGGVYAVALSATTDTGFTALPGLFVSLDLDPLFALSFPAPASWLFTNFQGTLDGFGMATGILTWIPDLVPLRWAGITYQAAVTLPSGLPQLTNPLPLVIQP